MDKMQLQDLPEVLAIEEEVLPNHWTEKDFRYELIKNPYAKLYVLRAAGEIVGYCDIWIIFERLEIASIAVAKKHQGKGFGKQIMEHIEDVGNQYGCEFAFLEVRKSNVAARNLYKKCGYTKLRIKRDYYQDNHEDAYELMKGLYGN